MAAAQDRLNDPAPRRVGILLGSLEAGGAQRMALALATGLLSRGLEVRVICVDRDREMDVVGEDAVHEGVARRIRVLGRGSARDGTVRKVLAMPLLQRRLRRLVADERLDVMVSFMERANLMSLRSCRGLPRIISIRKHIEAGLRDKSLLKRWLVVRGYRRWLSEATLVHCNSHASAMAFQQRFAVPTDKLSVILNSVDPGIVTQGEAAPEGGGAHLLGPQTVVSVGRLTFAKGQLSLLRAFATVADSVPAARLVLVGDGPLRGVLEQACRALKLTDRVAMVGFQRNPYAWISRAGVFALPSRAEGFPNALLEALMLGRAVIAADCPSGPREILAPDSRLAQQAKTVELASYGVLVPPPPGHDPPATAPLLASERHLAEGLRRLLSDEQLRAAYSGKARSRAEMFSPARADAAWHELIESALASGA